VRAELWGTDHTELDAVASATAGDRAALAITRGRYAKSYRHVDDNEDAVAVVVAPSGTTLLVCADGHNGATASHVAMREVLASFGDEPPPALSDEDWLALFARVNEAVIATKAPGSVHPSSNTVLLVALVTAGEISWAAIGDGALVLARPGAMRGRQLNKQAMRFVGYPMSRRQLKGTVQRGRTQVDPGEWVVLVTDGLSEFVAPLRPADVVPRVLAMAARDRDGGAESAALALIETACSAGAGDNVAAAVLAP
jgi:serine/threonine protein phosphatase PrpC